MSPRKHCLFCPLVDVFSYTCGTQNLTLPILFVSAAETQHITPPCEPSCAGVSPPQVCWLSNWMCPQICGQTWDIHRSFIKDEGGGCSSIQASGASSQRSRPRTVTFPEMEHTESEVTVLKESGSSTWLIRIVGYFQRSGFFSYSQILNEWYLITYSSQ